MVSSQDGRVSSQVVEVVHDDGHEQVEHQKRAEEDERDEVGVGEGRAAGLEGVDNFAGRLVVLERPRVAHAARFAGQHDARPRLSGGTPEIIFVLKIWIFWGLCKTISYFGSTNRNS